MSRPIPPHREEACEIPRGLRGIYAPVSGSFKWWILKHPHDNFQSPDSHIPLRCVGGGVPEGLHSTKLCPRGGGNFVGLRDSGFKVLRISPRWGVGWWGFTLTLALLRSTVLIYVEIAAGPELFCLHEGNLTKASKLTNVPRFLTFLVGIQDWYYFYME